jgi:hypothetical protein
MGALTVDTDLARANPAKHPLLARRTIGLVIADGIYIFKTSISEGQ